MRGWLRIQRGLFAHEFFPPEPMSQREAWMYMLARAAYKDTTHRAGGRKVYVPRGSFFCTQRELQREFRWRSHHKVQKFLDRLAAEGMITQAVQHKKTHITITSFDQYQVREERPTAPEQENSGGAPQADDTSREQLLRAMGLQPSDMRPNGKIHGDRADMIEAERWTNDLGLSLEEQLTVITEVMARKRDGAPNSFKYFTGAMQRRAGDKNRPPIEPTQGDGHEPSSQDGFSASTTAAGRAHSGQIEAFARAISEQPGGSQPDGTDTAPAEAACG